MKRSSYAAFALLMVVSVVLFLAGCGNPTGSKGGGSSTTTPQLSTSQTKVPLSGTVVAPAGTNLAEKQTIIDRLASFIISKAYALTGHTPVSGATVKAYDFYTDDLVDSTSTDTNGYYALNNIPSGIDVVIVAEKDVAGGKIRLSTVIPDVNVQTTIGGSIDAASTLVSEQMCTYLGQNFRVAIDDINYMMASAEASLATTTEADLCAGRCHLKEVLGNGLVSNEVTYPVILATPSNIKMSVAAAKAMVQDVRDCSFNSTRFASIETDTQENALNTVLIPHWDELRSYITGTMEPWISNTIIPSVCADTLAFITSEAGPYFEVTNEALVSYFGATGTLYTYLDKMQNAALDVDSVIGKTATVTYGAYSVDTAANGYKATLIGSTQPNVWEFILASSKTIVVTLETTSTPASGYPNQTYMQYNFTAVGGSKHLDASGTYYGYIDMNSSTDIYPTNVNLSGRFKDDDLPNDVTFSLKFTPSYGSNHIANSVTLNGSFESDELKFNGTVTSNLTQDNDISFYNYPGIHYYATSVDYNGTLQTGLSNFSGSVYMDGTVLGSGASAKAAITDFSASGILTYADYKMDGTITGQLYQDANYPSPSKIQLNGELTSSVLSMNGLLDADIATDTLGGVKMWYPSHINTSGTMSTRTVSLNGSFSADIACTVID